MTHYEIHQANQLRNKKYEGEYGEAQQGVRGHFSADILIE